jgi:hypothetical protein
MSLEPVLARVAQIDTLLADPASAAGGTAAGAGAGAAGTATASTSAAGAATSVGGGTSTASSSFANLLDSVLSPEASATASILNPGGTSSTSGSGGDPLAGDESSIESALQSALSGASGGSTGVGVASGTSSSASSLTNLLGSLGGASSGALTGLGGAPAAASAGGNQAIAAIAETQVGQQEVPLGSNNGPAVAEYRTAAAGAEPGEPWCAQFASWCAKQAGAPLGAEGQGFSAVSQIWAWAQQTGRAIPNGPGVVPKPGDLICFGDAHVGIVSGVLPNGDIETVEGNYDNRVVNNIRGPGEATGYVNMSPGA